jgi:hypothetical protein
VQLAICFGLLSAVGLFCMIVRQEFGCSWLAVFCFVGFAHAQMVDSSRPGAYLVCSYAARGQVVVGENLRGLL